MENKGEKKEWFVEWFNSPFYHILYQNRDYTEAQEFINKLAALLHFQANDRMLDIACGRGRHAVYLNARGYDVTGIDISPDNIAYARQFENDKLHSYIHDMRNFFREEAYDFALNLFTSFGYFETDTENKQAVCTATRALKEKGIFVLDFFNTPKVIKQLSPYEIKSIAGIDFHIRKQVSGGYVLKDIGFVAEGKAYISRKK